MLKRLTILLGLAVACQLATAPQSAEAHGWRSRCGSNYNGYSYCSPQSSYYSTYNNCSPYYSSYGPSYGPSPYASNPYNSVPYGSSPYGSVPQFNSFGPGFGGLGGGGLMGPMGASFPAGANLVGSLLQPSYLSMPVGVGNGGSGYLQIPVGNPAGRTSYLQIPVNSGYGPPSYLQIELGRNPGSTVRDTQAPGPSPLGSVPGVNIPTADRVAFDIPKTASDDVPPVVPAVQGNSVQAIAAAGSNASRAKISTAPDKRFEANVTTQSVKFQFVSMPKAIVTAPDAPQSMGLPRRKDTSFSLIDDDLQAPTLVASDRDRSTADELPTVASGVNALWAAAK